MRPNYSCFLILGVVLGCFLFLSVSLKDYFSGCYRANTSVRPYGICYIVLLYIFVRTCVCALFLCLIILFWAPTPVCPYNNKKHCKSNSSLKAKGLRGAPQRVRQAMLGKVGDMFERSESLNGPSTCDIRRATRHEATEECRK